MAIVRNLGLLVLVVLGFGAAIAAISHVLAFALTAVLVAGGWIVATAARALV